MNTLDLLGAEAAGESATGGTRFWFGFLVSLIREFRNGHQGKLENNFIRVWDRAGRLEIPTSSREEREGEKIMPFKNRLEVRKTVRKPRVSEKACLGFWSVSEKDIKRRPRKAMSRAGPQI